MDDAGLLSQGLEQGLQDREVAPGKAGLWVSPCAAHVLRQAFDPHSNPERQDLHHHHPHSLMMSLCLREITDLSKRASWQGMALEPALPKAHLSGSVGLTQWSTFTLSL